jgi:hypothetical protein
MARPVPYAGPVLEDIATEHADKFNVVKLNIGWTLEAAVNARHEDMPPVTSAGNTVRRQSPPARRVARIMWS